jgi:hypothetical protein
MRKRKMKAETAAADLDLNLEIKAREGYRPYHPNESLAVVLKGSNVLVRELQGGPGRYKRLLEAINSEKYNVMYISDFLGQRNRQIVEKSKRDGTFVP